jgi:hypothetical protein
MMLGASAKEHESIVVLLHIYFTYTSLRVLRVTALSFTCSGSSKEHNNWTTGLY